MSNIRNLPEEVLLMIYKELNESDINQCQRVCRSWYNKAHLQFLQVITLHGHAQIEQFINSIDSNDNSSYLNAVKEIGLYKKGTSSTEVTEEESHQFDRTNIRKLLFRFPNLTRISLWGPPSIYAPFDARLSNELLKKCPNLTTFSVAPNNVEALYKFRKLVTQLILWRGHDFGKYGGITEFFCGFPRLTAFTCDFEEIEPFKNLLPVFEKVSTIKKVSVSELLNDSPNFGKTYLSRRKQDKQDLLIKRLSNVTDLSVSYKEGFCVNSLQFICKYFTGIKEFYLHCNQNYQWNDSQIQVFCKDIMDFACSLEKKHITCSLLGLETLSTCLPIVLQKVMNQKSAILENERTLHLTIKDDELSLPDTGKLEIRDSGYVNVTVSKELDIDEIISEVFEGSAPMNNIDDFILSYHRPNTTHRRGVFILEGLELIHYRVDINTYEKILQLMPYLKRVKLDIPAHFEESSSMKVICEKKHALVTQVTLQPTEDGQYQSMLNWCFSAFPNLKRLDLHLSSGIWNESTVQFHVNLPKYTLKKLTIDMTPVKRKTVSHLGKQGSGEDFFVFEMETLESSERLMCKIPIDFSSVEIVEEIDLQGFILGEDYLRVNVIIKDVQRVELLMDKAGENPSYLDLNNVKCLVLEK